MNLAEALVRIVGDWSGFRREVEKEGDKAATTLGTRIKGGLGTALKAGGVALGTALAVGLGAGMKGLLELDTAMGNFRAETGATEEEVKSASKAVLDFSKRNLQPIAEISGTMAALRTEMQLTQEQAEDLTEPFLKFAEVTGQTGPAAVKGFDDILDAWNLTAEDSQGIMDQLIESHQQYGGNIAENQAALVRLAPALQAANMSFDEGIGLLNLFAASGVDASVGAVALQKALTKVKSPEELQRLIADISSTVDPFERARLAADLFGARAGAKMAQALAPGGASLESYAISADEAAGATTEAADAFEGTFGRQAQLWINNIKGMATGLLTELGPGIGGLAIAVPILGGVLKPLFKSMALGTTKILPKLGGAIKAMALNIPTALGYLDLMITKLKGVGLASGLAMAGIVGVGLVLGQMQADGIRTMGEFAKRADALGVSFDDLLAQARALASQTGVSEMEALNTVVTGMETAAETARNTGSSMSLEWAQAWSKMAGTTAYGVAQVTSETSGGLEAGAPTVRKSAKAALDSPIWEAMQAARAHAAAEALAIPGEIAQALIDGQASVDSGMTALTTLMEDSLSDAAKIAHLKGLLASDELAAGLIDERADVRASAMQLKADIIEQLQLLESGAADAAVDMGTTLEEQIRLQAGAAAAAAAALAKAVRDELQFDPYFPPPGGAPPPAPKPKPKPPKKPPPQYAAGAWETGDELARLHRREMVVPAAPAEALRRWFGGAMTGRGGDTYNISLLDRYEVRSVRDIGSGLRMLGEVGVLPARRPAHA